ncbi:helix-turn-helix transcriptional regulator [Streptomyces sp. NPDC046977]|uniref:helix-turn-helix domain-containing protein n=1 Tax=Streptomyces sp. NPDC046977 TaxID=3154703 RepID=UPI0033E20CD8
MGVPPLAVGDRIRHWRSKRGRTQAAVAGLCGITEVYLSKIERGLKTPSLEVLHALAGELGVPLAALLSEEPATEARAVAEWGIEPTVPHALMGYGPAASRHPATPVVLRERVESAWRVWQSSPERFTQAAAVLPALIADTEHATRAYARGSDAAARREVLRCAADLYFMLRSYCRRTGRVDLSLMAADRALRAAQDADDPIRIAAAQWNLGHVLLADGEEDGAQQVALLGIEQLQQATSDPVVPALTGALQLVAVVADSRRRRWSAAHHRLTHHALPRARESGEGNAMWTVFGPTNVLLHHVSIEMEAGEAAEALRAADQVDAGRLPSLERHFTFLLEVAHCYALRREDPAVLVHLLDLEEMAPEDLARSPLARDMVVGLRRRVRPTYRRQVEGLADRMGLA